MADQRQANFTTPGGQAQQSGPIALSVSIPAFAAPGMTPAGGVSIEDDFTAVLTLSPPLKLPEQLIGFLQSGTICFSAPNIGAQADSIPVYVFGNNRLTIAWNGGAAQDLIVPTGLYSVGDVAQALNILAIAQGWITSLSNPLVVFTGIPATQQLIFEVSPLGLAGGVFPAGGVVISFTNPSAVTGLNNSIGPVLGFPAIAGSTITIAGGGATASNTISPTAADFAETSSYLINCSIVRASSFQGQQGQLLYVVPLGSATPQTNIAIAPNVYFPVNITAGTYSQVRFWITSQSGQKLKLIFFQSPTVLSVTMARTRHDGSY